MSFDRTTLWARGLVNLNQTTQERQFKYQYALSLGAQPGHARRMRDWRLPKINRRFGIDK